MRIIALRSILLLLWLTCLGFVGAQAQVNVFTNVSVIDPGTSSVHSAMNVIVEAGLIRSIEPSSSPIPTRARRIEGKGRFLIPGLQDSHVHLTKAGIGALGLFLANGVTSVRDMGSDLSEVLAWRSEIEAGRLAGPRITAGGQILESRANVDRMLREQTVEPVARIRLPVSNPEQGRRAVQELKASGADHVKMRTAADAATFQAIAAECKRLNIPFATHSFGSIDEMMEAGVGSVEHFASFPPLDKLSKEERRSLFERMAKSGIFLSTTISNIDGSIRIPYEDSKRRLNDRKGLIDHRRRYLCGYLIEDWREQVEERKDGAYDAFIKMLPAIYRDIREMREAGVRVMAGTDVGVAFMYPGFSLHDELSKLVEHVGFSPMEALRAATYDAAAFHKSGKHSGSIAPGYVADLVLLDASPLSDIANTKRIRGVMARGKWIDRTAIGEMLKRAALACN